MLGGNHYKKKMEKKERKKEAKKEKRQNAHPTKSSGAAPTSALSSGSRAGGASPPSATSSSGGGSKSHNKSTLKGPVVGYGDYGTDRGARDAANDRKGIPFKNTREAQEYNRSLGRGRGAARHAGAAPTSSTPTHRQSLASSQAQRRRVLRKKGGDDLLSHFKEQMVGSTFRLLNEQIYNSPNALAAQILRDEPTFRDYHNGYRQQLVQWPMNPNTIIADALLSDKRGRFPTAAQQRAKQQGSEENANSSNSSSSNHRGIPKDWVLADMGCGEAQIAARMKPLGYTVHSFDFCAMNEHVTVADSTQVPLEDSSVDVCIFSLSLMATDYERSLFEAFRVLKPHRLLKIVEVRSRIPFPNRFCEMVCSIGFTLESQDVAGDYFVTFDFTKKEGMKAPSTAVLAHAPGDVLLPSMYKKR